VSPQSGSRGSIRQILREESNPHLKGIFSSGANLTLFTSIQTAMGADSLHPNPLQPPTKHTVTSKCDFYFISCGLSALLAP
jgi:hypothetical protein